MSNYGPVIGMLGGMLAIFGLFLGWFTVEWSVWGFTFTETATGWEIFRENNDVFEYYFLPLVVLILAIVACVVSIASVAGGKEMGAISMLLGLVIIVLPLVFYYMSFVNESTSVLSPIQTAEVGVGLILCAVGGFLTMVGGIVTWKN